MAPRREARRAAHVVKRRRRARVGRVAVVFLAGGGVGRGAGAVVQDRRGGFVEAGGAPRGDEVE